jgi:acyl dehydratase
MAQQQIGVVTQEGVDALRRRVGALYNLSPGITEVREDDIRTFCQRLGENNPLYLDPEYGKASPWGSIIAPPGYFDLFHHHSATAVGGLRGVQSYYAGCDMEFFEPLRPGDFCAPTYRPQEPQMKEGRFAGPLAIVRVEDLYRNQRGRVVVRVNAHVVRTSRTQAGGRGKYDHLKGGPQYTPDELQEIWNAYDRYTRPGATPRYWEDVQVGDQMPDLVKGPLRTIEIALFGGGGGGSSHYYQMSSLRSQPGYGERDPSTGVVGSPLAGHWEPGLAQRLGIPGIYDVGSMRVFWMCQAAENWAGDYGWMKRINCDIRRFNLVGDTSWIKGHVASKWVDGDQYLVRLQLHVEDQRGEVTAPGWAIVALPSRNGHAKLPYRPEVQS